MCSVGRGEERGGRERNRGEVDGDGAGRVHGEREEKGAGFVEDVEGGVASDTAGGFGRRLRRFPGSSRRRCFCSSDVLGQINRSVRAAFPF